MTEPAGGDATRVETPPPDPTDASTGELVGRPSGQVCTPAPADVPRGWSSGMIIAVVLFSVAGVQADVARVKRGISR
jgi:hypothetical protein